MKRAIAFFGHAVEIVALAMILAVMLFGLVATFGRLRLTIDWPDAPVPAVLPAGPTTRRA